jgi:hypothetical protein
MRLFDYVKSKGADVTRIDGVLFSIFLVENTMNFQNFLKDLSPSEPFMFDHGWGNGYVGLRIVEPHPVFVSAITPSRSFSTLFLL